MKTKKTLGQLAPELIINYNSDSSRVTLRANKTAVKMLKELCVYNPNLNNNLKEIRYRGLYLERHLIKTALLRKIGIYGHMLFCDTILNEEQISFNVQTIHVFEFIRDAFKRDFKKIATYYLNYSKRSL